MVALAAALLTPPARGQENGAAAAADRLRPPGADGYEGPIDWSSLPPWQQTAFYGVRAKGQTFVFVVDCSGSMADDLRLERAKAELLRSVGRMRWPQRFLVILYNDRTLTMPGHVPQTGGVGAIGRLKGWLTRVEAEGPTEPDAAMRQALAVRPDAVFLLTDGELPDGAAQAIDGYNTRRVPVHCIAVGGAAGGAELRRIAGDSGGSLSVRP